MRMTVAAWRPSAPSRTMASPSGSGSSRKSGGVTWPSVPRGKSSARRGYPGFGAQGEEAIPEGVNGDGRGFRAKSCSDPGSPRNRAAIRVVLASAAAERVADLAEQARPAAVHRDFLLTERCELA